MGILKMDARFAARMATGLGLAFFGLIGVRGEAFAQYPQYYPPGPYAPAPPPTYRAAPLPLDDNDDDLAPPSAPRPGRPSNPPYGGPSGIQSEALPPAGPTPYGGPSPYGGNAYPDGGPPPGRGYRYGNWEPMRPPGDVYGPGGVPPGPGYANPPPMDITPNPANPPAGYAALPPDYQPEVGQPKELPPQFRRQMVDYPSREPAGTIVIDTPNTYLYLVLGGGKALRYGIGVGREGFTWSGREKISRMSEWPDWHPPKEMIDRQPYLPRFMAGGESNPLGARALYLGNTLYRIHGTNQPSTIGSFVSSGCIRLTNADIEDLYSRVTVGSRVVVLPSGPARQSVRADTTGSAR
jgi:lipoprotein-anchoring transpeptidase ErfK/SrfK